MLSHTLTMEALNVTRLLFIGAEYYNLILGSDVCLSIVKSPVISTPAGFHIQSHLFAFFFQSGGSLMHLILCEICQNVM